MRRILPLLAMALLPLSACGRDAAYEGDATAVETAAMPAAAEGSDLSMERRAAAPAPAAEPAVAQVAAADTAGAGSMATAAAATLDPMIIRTGRALIRVDSVDQGVAAVRALVRRVGGIVGNVEMRGGTEQTRAAILELRIPSERWDEAIGGLDPIGVRESLEVTAQDVGEEYTDVQARVANARRLESRLLDLLENRTGRLDEVLNVEREIARVREQIERLDGRLRYLRTRAAVSVLTVTLREPEALIGDRPGEHPLRDAFGQAWDNFIGLLAGLIAVSGALIPLALLVILLVQGVRALRRGGDARPPRRRPGPPPREPAPPPEEPALRG